MLCRALNVARSRSPPLPLLHTTGLASILAHVQADRQRAPQRATAVLLLALADLDAAGDGALSAGERLRRLGVLNKLAELAERMGDAVAEEKYAGRAVTEVLRASATQRRALGEMAKADGRGSTAATATKQAPGEDDPGLDDLLPGWLDRTQVGATVDRLAGLYLRQGKAECVPRMLSASSIRLTISDLVFDPPVTQRRSTCTRSTSSSRQTPRHRAPLRSRSSAEVSFCCRRGRFRCMS